MREALDTDIQSIFGLAESNALGSDALVNPSSTEETAWLAKPEVVHHMNEATMQVDYVINNEEIEDALGALVTIVQYNMVLK